MKSRNWLVRVGAVSVVIGIVLVIVLIAVGAHSDESAVGTEVEESEAVRKYEETIEPLMLSGNVSTSVTADSQDVTATFTYAISGINSMVHYNREEGNDKFEIWIWNNTEQYFMRSIINGEDNSYKIELTEESRNDLNACIVGFYTTVSSYLNVASKARILEFEQVDDVTYKAVSELEDSQYELIFSSENGYLSNIEMLNDSFEDTAVNIHFDKFNVSELSNYEETDKTCDVDYVLETLDYQ